MKTKFFQNCIGASTLIVAISLFIHSIGVSYGAPRPEKFMQQGTNKIGKYQASYSTVGADGDVIYTFLITDTETGKTVSYFCSKSSQYKWKKDSSQLPENLFNN